MHYPTALFCFNGLDQRAQPISLDEDCVW